MARPTKIATCCYCASRTVLTLDHGRHELVCTSCGAPLRDLKMMPKPTERQAVSHQPKARSFAPAAPSQVKKRKSRKPEYSRKKPRNSWLRVLAEEAFDLVEEIFD